MAVQYSIQKMVSDGTLSTITLGIQYLQRNDIYMRIAGEETPQIGAPSGYTWSFINNTTLKILPVVPNGVEVVVYRRTGVDAMYNVYSQNAQFDEATIDENNQQLLYIAQEYLEQGLPGTGVDTIEYVRDDGSFTYYRMRRTDGSYSEEFTVPSASSSTKVFARESLRRSYAEAGYNLVDGSFEAGGTLVNSNDVLLQERTGKAFSGPAGTVAAGTNPASGGFVDRSHTLDQVASVDSFIQALTGAAEYTGNLPSSNFYGEITQFTPYGNNNLKVYRTRDGHEWELDAIGIVGISDVTLYVSSGATGDGLTIGSPMSFSTLQANVTGGIYNNMGSLHINLIDEFYGHDDAITDFGAITGTKVYLRSINRRGYSWLTGGRKYTYSQSGSYYSAVINSTPILYCFNTRELDGNGCPIVYKKVDNVAGLVPGSWCKVGTTLYVRPIGIGSDIDKSIVAVLGDSNKFQWSKNDDAVICENIRWATGNIDCLSFAPQSLEAQAVFVRNIFLAGKNAGFGVEAPAYKIAMLDCISGYAGKDGFNYRATGLSSLNGAIALEVNCKGYYAGLYKYEGGNATTNSNNGSTAHDGMTIIRLGGAHYECEGPVIADVNGCYSINYDTQANGVIDSTTGDKASWLFFKATSPTFQLSRTVMVNCQGGKSDIDLLTGQGVNLIYDKLDVSEKKVNLFNGNSTLRITK